MLVRQKVYTSSVLLLKVRKNKQVGGRDNLPPAKIIYIIMKYLKYLKYLIKHKWFVMIECFKVGLYWRGIVHDMSKFFPSEFFPYVNYFSHRNINDCSKPDGDKEFDFAWLLHQKRNKHHWQWWVLPKDDGTIKVFEMPHKYRLEMLCDWNGAGRAQGKGDNTKKWYKENKDKMKFHPKTEKWINNILSIK